MRIYNCRNDYGLWPIAQEQLVAAAKELYDKLVTKSSTDYDDTGTIGMSSNGKREEAIVCVDQS